MQYNNKRSVVVLPIVAAVFLLLGMVINNKYYTSKSVSVPVSAQHFSESKIGAVVDMINEAYVDSINVDSLEEKAIFQIIKDLDPHSVYIPASEMEKTNEDMVGNFGGVGVLFYVYNDTVTVVNVVKGGPSESAGVMSGDRVVMVDDSLVAGVKISSSGVMKLMRGKEGSNVKLTIYRRSLGDTLVKNIVRGAIPVSSVSIAYMIDDTTGFILVDHFGMQTYSEFMSGVNTLKTKGMKRLIVDMRNNEGGILPIALRMVNEFLPADRLILYTQGNRIPRSDYRSNGRGTLQNIPVEVLINEGSASAAEIFAGALQDNDRATIIGRRSFGKGLVQEQRILSDGSGLRLTIARYYIPSGRCIQKPYELGESGKESYYNEVWDRLERGEFYQADSIHFDESQKFSTYNGRTVYGGGGIMPDYFIPADTNNYTPYLQKLVYKACIYDYTFGFMDKHRAEMEKNITNVAELKSYLKKFDLVGDVVAFAESKGIKRNNAEIRESEKLIRVMTEAYIGRHMFDDQGFYPIYQDIDETLQKALKIKPVI